MEIEIHAVHEIFNENKTDAILLVDFENTSNTINRKKILLNIGYLSPDLAAFIYICSVMPARLLIIGGKEFMQREEKTDNDQVAVLAYVIILTPPVNNLKNIRSDNKNMAFADGLKNPGKFHHLILWWDRLQTKMPKYGNTVII